MCGFEEGRELPPEKADDAWEDDHAPYGPDNEWPVAKAQSAVLTEVTGELGATVDQVVLAQLIGHPVPTVPVVGAGSAAQSAEILAALDLVLDEDQRRRLDAAA
ncbi:aldo/keto reductase [Kitasatospora sp. NPDC004669]|uniref:aldo/keto reductase n=1 Tax=Kitasatospora sp. NPDC004669 TaxID=3154555 RepID=UPI0033AD5A14